MASMSYLLVRDFRVIRIACHHKECGVVFELAPDHVEAAMKKTNGTCPLCGKPFTMPDVEGGADVVTMLAKVVLALNKLAPNVGISLPVAAE